MTQLWHDTTNNTIHDDMDGSALSLPGWPIGTVKVTTAEASGRSLPCRRYDNRLVPALSVGVLSRLCDLCRLSVCHQKCAQDEVSAGDGNFTIWSELR